MPSSSAPGAVLIPVKAFAQAKGRLVGALDEPSRARLAKEMATHVVREQSGMHVAICCDDEDVAHWAHEVGAEVVWCPGTGLNGAVGQGYVAMRDAGYSHVAIAHSDLPLASSLGRLLGWPGVTLVPDRHRTGTNVMALPTDLEFRFSYGVESFRLHTAEAVRHRCGVRVVHDAALGWDVDHPADLQIPGSALLHRYRPKANDP